MITSWRRLRLALAFALAILLAGSVGISSVAAKPIEDRASVKVIVMPAPTTGPDSVAYTVKVVNRGAINARNTTITVPFDPMALKLVDVQFSGTAAWVTQIGPGSFEMRTQRLRYKGGVTFATVRFATLKAGAGLTERLTYHWSDAVGGGHGRSNLPLSAAAVLPFAALTHREAVDGHFFSTNVFVPGEPVVFWYHLPDGTVVPTEVKHGVIVAADSTNSKHHGRDYAFADGYGMINLEFSTGHLAAGEYTMVARGEISGITAVGGCGLH